jgi:hypothetical protein
MFATTMHVAVSGEMVFRLAVWNPNSPGDDVGIARDGVNVIEQFWLVR